MISFVVLHYLNEEVTSKCIALLLNQSTHVRYKIVVVDNFSNNNSLQVLKKKWQDNEKVHFITCRKNFGFAEGNNAGYIYSKEYLCADTIIIMNNDVYIYDLSFVYKIQNLQCISEYEIIAPAIISKEGANQNPFRLESFSNVRLIQYIITKILLRIVYKTPIINKIKSRYSYFKNKNHNLRKAINEENNIPMVVPHGSCIIFTKRWISKEDLAFCPYTFLYGEEDILYEYLVNKNYKSIFVPSIKVTHLEDVSTDTFIKTDLKKTKFFHEIFVKIKFYITKNKMLQLTKKTGYLQETKFRLLYLTVKFIRKTRLWFVF